MKVLVDKAVSDVGEQVFRDDIKCWACHYFFEIAFDV